ncbi:hypothetical protein LO763_11675 [Glycomyces sp. A-F 0318]|uniref:hypothetical protein n=1 Tax=Glycomyces amatae TaxID=2881355 RepID=UPI001E5E1AB1|nr:hypothetical protein [Glycomyces amatae]MCD0444281.1 hypothetical protein [Glycomyces amatae]
MSRGFHEACNTALRAAMADLLSFDRDGWTLLGCFDTGSGPVWQPLARFAQVIAVAVDKLTTEADIELAMDEELTGGDADAEFEDLPHLRGIAEVHLHSNDHGRYGSVSAVFDDAWRHQINWEAGTDTPVWEVFSPPEVARSPLATDKVLAVLLEAILTACDQTHRLVSKEQQALSTCLQDLIAECNMTLTNAVFVIVYRDEQWEALTASDLTARVGAKVESGMSVADAVGELAAEWAVDPQTTIPTLRGVGTVVHFEAEDGGTQAHLIALCDQTLHAAEWDFGQDRPDWQILPVAAADPDYWVMVLAYTQLAEAIRGDHR